jgi:hypothetical protein
MRLILAVLLICLLGCCGGSFRGTIRSGTVFGVTGFVSIIELTTLPRTTICDLSAKFRSGHDRDFCGNLTRQFLWMGLRLWTLLKGANCATALVIFIN